MMLPLTVAGRRLTLSTKALTERFIFIRVTRETSTLSRTRAFDLICTHPPYADIIKYSENIPEDLSHCKVKDFIEQMKPVAAECFRVLKKDKFCAVLMGDTRQKGHMVPMSFDVMKVFQDAGFKLKELIIKEQHNCKATGYWKTNSVKYNFLLIAHEYLFVFRK